MSNKNIPSAESEFGKRYGLGLFGKYVIGKVGEEIDPNARYFVLRLDTDPLARIAALAYAEAVESENKALARDLREAVKEVKDKRLAEAFCKRCMTILKILRPEEGKERNLDPIIKCPNCGVRYLVMWDNGVPRLKSIPSE